MLKTLLGLATVLILGTFAAPKPLAAQDCGKNCSGCGAFGSEGVNYGPEAPWQMACKNFTSHCDVCEVEPQRSNSGDATENLLLLLRTGDELAVREAIGQNSGRLRVSGTRNLVILFGTTCDAEAVGAVAFVDAARAALIRREGVPLFVDSIVRTNAID